MRLVYFGCEEFAVPALITLANSDHEVVAVVTRPRSVGRDGAVSPNQVGVQAEHRSLEVLVYEDPRTPQLVEKVKRLKADLGIFAAFGEDSTDFLRNAFRGGSIGIHPALLPKYRGPSSINWAILNGERKTGITVFRMSDQPYAGPILVQRETMIRPDENWTELHFRLARIACDAINAALKILEQDLHSAGIPQEESLASWTTELSENDGYLRFDEPAEVIALRCRAMWPKPGTFCRYINEDGEVEHLQVVRAKAERGRTQLSPGTITSDFKVATAEGILQFQELKPAKGPVMGWEEFVRERRVCPGERFETIPR
jgi:methionyl-tRNA formyltransferase